MSTFSPVGLQSSDGMRMCVCACACVRVCGWNELNVYTTLAYPCISSFRTIHKHVHTRILKPFEDSKLTGLKVDIAAPSCKNLECLRDTRLLISSHTHACTHARTCTHTYATHATHTHMRTHTLQIHALLVLGW